MKTIFRNILAAGLVLPFVACEKVIDIDLNDSDPLLVIESNIHDEGGPYQVRLTKTVNFDESNSFPGVSGAVVTIIDSDGATEVLNEVSPGTYEMTTITGVPGKSYTLTIDVEGESYESTSAMPLLTEIDTVLVEQGLFGPFRYLTVLFPDDPNVENYYRVLYVRNGEPDDGINVVSDMLAEGGDMEVPLFFFGDDSLTTGDVVEVILQNIDKTNYEYLRSLNGTINSAVSATPANPVSPFSPNALGYFSAHSVHRKTITVQ